MNNPISTQTLQEMKTYYRERAPEYDEWFYRQGRYNHGPEANACWFAEVDEVFAALDSFGLAGDVLELACGTGIWTERLVRTASMVTAVDASLEMIEINRAKVSSDRVSYLLADLFSWQPERIYDAIFFGFWISHVPLEQLDTFLHSIVAMLRPKGKVFFADSQRESTGTTANRQLPEQDIQITNRTLNDGRSFEIIKNFYNPNNLANRCSHAGLDMIICETNTHFLYGYGFRR